MSERCAFQYTQVYYSYFTEFFGGYGFFRVPVSVSDSQLESGAAIVSARSCFYVHVRCSSNCIALHSPWPNDRQISQPVEVSISQLGKQQQLENFESCLAEWSPNGRGS